MKNNEGFTLIELLAVIVILGILMIIAIPAVSEYISNSKKDAFINNAKEYVNQVRNAYNANDIICAPGSRYNAATAADYVISAQETETGNFYIPIVTSDYWKDKAPYYKRGCPYQNAEILLDNTKKSPWGNEYAGIIEINKEKETDETTITYKVAMKEPGYMIFNTSNPRTIDVDTLNRKSVRKGTTSNINWQMNLSIYKSNYTDDGVYMCRINE